MEERGNGRGRQWKREAMEEGGNGRERQRASKPLRQCEHRQRASSPLGPTRTTWPETYTIPPALIAWL